MEKSTAVYVPLDEASEEQGIGGYLLRKRSASNKNARWLVAATSLLFVSTCLNGAFWFMRPTQPPNLSGASSLAHQRSPYTNLGYDREELYTHHSEYTSSNATRADEMWDSLDTSPVAVRLSPQWAQSKQLEPSWSFPWDSEQQVYFIKVFHQLHCLKILRRRILDDDQGISRRQGLSNEHLMHCLDTLRQDLSCNADDTLMPSVKVLDGIGADQLRQCRSIDALVEWSQHPDRHACYRQLSDYDGIAHPIERYAFCREDAPFYEEMAEYFERNGHQDPFDRA